MIHSNQKGFSIIEVLIGIMIFSLGLVSIFMLILSALRMNEYSKNSIIASNLAREGVEIVRNIRDNNYTTLRSWNTFPGTDMTARFSTGVFYTLENDPTTQVGVKMKKIDLFAEGKTALKDKMLSYQLYLTPDNIYTYDASASNTPTHFYRYVTFSDVTTSSGVEPEALKVTSKVIWYKNGYHEIQLDTVIAHFQRD